MSTKTTIKRVALVAAVALTLGGFSAVSASAANTYIFTKTADGVSSGTVSGASAAAANGVAGPANFVQIGLTTGDNGIITVSGASSSILSASDTSVVVASGGASASTSSSASGAYINVSTPVVGVITVNYFKNVSAGVYASTATESVVITVAATASNGVYSAAKSTVYIVSGDTNTVATADSSAIAVRNDTSVVVATIQVSYKDALGNAMSGDSVTATITGPGVIWGVGDTTTAASATGGAVTQTTAANSYSKSTNYNAAGNVNFYVFGNKQTGLSTITIKNTAGTVLATKTLTFSSTTAASLTAASAVNYISAATDAITVTVKDSAGNLIPGYTVKGTADAANTVATLTTASVATDATGVATFNVTPVAGKSGAAKFSFADSTGLITSTATTNVSGTVAAALTITPDVASAAPGQKITYTVEAKDANGLALADGTYTFFAAKPSVSAALGSNPIDTTTVTLVDGKATGTAYAPAAGTLVVSWTLVGTLAGAASGPVAKGLVGTTISTSVEVTGSADSALAVDAANAATDAANAAAEEASNATEAASEALAAVNSLATTVASLIAGIKAQLTSLTALIKKIQAKVKA